MGFLDWIKGRKKQQSEKPTADVAAPPQQAADVALTSGVSVTPRSVKPLTPRPTKPLRKNSDAEEPAPAASLPSKMLLFSVSDLIPKLPEDIRQHVQASFQTEINIPSDEILSDLTHGRATISLATLLDACPDFFGGDPPSTTPDRIALPLNKVVQQIGDFATRPDQEQPERPERTFETPFLKGAVRDDAIGMPATAPAPPSSELPAPPPLPKPPPLPSQAAQQPPKTISMPPAEQPVPMPAVVSPTQQPAAPATPPSRFATTMIPDPTGRRKPPATVRASVAGGKIRVGGNTTSLIKLPSEEPPKAVKPELPPSPTAPASTPTSIKMEDSPISKSKAPFSPPPASGMTPVAPPQSQHSDTPPVTTTLPVPKSRPFPSPFAKAQETARVTTKSDFLTGKAPEANVAPAASVQVPPLSTDLPAKPSPETPAAASTASTTSDDTLQISLAAIVKSLPVDHIEGDPDDIDPQLIVSFPKADILAQLAHGKVVSTVGVLRAALPESASRMFSDTSDDAEITLPLREILAALPQEALRKREDQIEEKLDLTFETPFARKAAEDAQRLAEEEEAARKAKEALASPAQVTLAQPTPAQPSDEQPLADSQPPGAQADAGPVPLPSPTPPAAAAAAPLPEPQSSPSPVRPRPPMQFISKRALRLGSDVAPPPSQHTPPSTEAPALPIEAPAQPAIPALDAPPPPEPEPAPEPKPVAAPILATPSEPSPQVLPSELTTQVQPPEPIAPSIPAAEPSIEVAPADIRSPAEFTTDKVEAEAALQEIFMTDEPMDARNVIAHILKLPGISGALLGTADGLKLAGSLSSAMNSDALCAITPSIMARLDKFAEETKLTNMGSFTLSTSSNLLSIFHQTGISLFIEHEKKEFAPGIRSRLVTVASHLAKIYK